MNRSAADGLQARCRDCRKAVARAYLEANREVLLERARQQYGERREKLAADRAVRRQARPHLGWQDDYRKRCLRYGLDPRYTSFTEEEMLDYWGVGRTCIHCGGDYEEIDHLIPVALGGEHSLANVAPCCAACNRAQSGDVRRARKGLL